MTACDFPLARVRADFTAYCQARLDPAGLYGAYRSAPRARCDLYSSCAIALSRVIMGEDFRHTLTPVQRRDWGAHLNSFARQIHGAGTGEYTDTFGHHPLHANGMVIGALGPLGEKQASPVRLYEEFAAPGQVAAWLDGLDWAGTWHASHLFWGGLHCFSFSARCSPVWRKAVFAWLDRNLDPVTGWWRRGVPHRDRHQPLGGAVHIFPIYEHHQRAFPCPRPVIDSTLALQLPAGNWRLPGGHGFPLMDYLDLDALYALAFMQGLAPDHRPDDIRQAVRHYAQLARDAYASRHAEIFSLHPHHLLAVISIFGLLQRLLPDEFVDAVAWSDIFSDRRLYLTHEVEVSA